MTDLIWTLVFAQVAMGGFDTLYHHELTERLAWRPSQARELRLHGVRNLAYAAMFLLLGWSRPQGVLAIALTALMLGELVLTLWDFVEEDRTRKLPASERITHTLLTLNYGVVLALVLPVLAGWAARPTALVPTAYGAWSGLCALAALAVVVFGLRDLAAAGRTRRIVASDPSPLVATLAPGRSVLVTGATGLIGRRLVAALVGAGHEVTALTRDRATAAGLPAPIRIVTDLDQIAADARIDAIVNLAGEPISDGLWTPAKRRRIVGSRLAVTRAVVALVARLERRPAVLVSGSAIGWYGLRDDEMLDETVDGLDCFSRTVCRRWERAALQAEDLGVRVVRLRIGLVLALDGGALSRMLTPFEFGLGGPFGAGRHWMSWIHLDDLGAPDRPRHRYARPGGTAQRHGAGARAQRRLRPRARPRPEQAGPAARPGRASAAGPGRVRRRAVAAGPADRARGGPGQRLPVHSPRAGRGVGRSRRQPDAAAKARGFPTRRACLSLSASTVPTKARRKEEPAR